MPGSRCGGRAVAEPMPAPAGIPKPYCLYLQETIRSSWANRAVGMAAAVTALLSGAVAGALCVTLVVPKYSLPAAAVPAGLWGLVVLAED